MSTHENGPSPESRWFKIGLISTLLAVIVHGYLSFRHVEVTYGDATGPSMCNVNSTFNCDVVAASDYSSLFGVPLAVLGMITNLILLGMAIIYRFAWKDGEIYTGRLVVYVSGFVLFMSLIMGGISLTQLSVYCIFCIATYGLSAITFLGFALSVPGVGLSTLADDVKAALTTNKGALWSLLAIPLLSWLVSGMLKSQFQVDSKKHAQFIAYGVNDWLQAKENDFSSLNALAKGATKEVALMTIQEFADFRCGHCRSAAPKLHNFTKARSDVRLEFYAFPLDGACNPSMDRSNGISCRLAKTVLCSGSKSWQVHDFIFSKQREFSSLSATDSVIKDMADELEIDHSALLKCVESEQTHNEIQTQAKVGEASGVQGTPAVFVNGKKLVNGQDPGLLKAVYEQLKK